MIDFHIITNKGERDHNEDYVGMKEANGKYCFLLADGLGGHGNGEDASKCVVENGLSFFEEHVNEEDWQGEIFPYCQDKLMELQKQEHNTAGMKTTLVLLRVEGNEAQYVHVGDSRGYYFKDGEVVSRTRDHSVPQMLMLSGEITEEEIRHHPDRNKLLRVMGIEWEDPQQEAGPVRDLREGQRHGFLLCTDGFWDWITEPEMAECLNKAKDAKEWISSMEEIVLKNGTGQGMDNYSAIGVIISGMEGKAGDEKANNIPAPVPTPVPVDPKEAMTLPTQPIPMIPQEQIEMAESGAAMEENRPTQADMRGAQNEEPFGQKSVPVALIIILALLVLLGGAFCIYRFAFHGTWPSFGKKDGEVASEESSAIISSEEWESAVTEPESEVMTTEDSETVSETVSEAVSEEVTDINSADLTKSFVYWDDFETQFTKLVKPYAQDKGWTVKYTSSSVGKVDADYKIRMTKDDDAILFGKGEPQAVKATTGKLDVSTDALKTGAKEVDVYTLGDVKELIDSYDNSSETEED